MPAYVGVIGASVPQTLNLRRTALLDAPCAGMGCSDSIMRLQASRLLILPFRQINTFRQTCIGVPRGSRAACVLQISELLMPAM